MGRQGEAAPHGLERLGENKANLRRLREQLASGRGVIPFVGAGLSVPFGMPGWRAFLLQQAEAAGVAARVGAALDAGEFEEAADLVEEARAPRAFHDALCDAFGDHHVDEARFRGTALSLVPDLAAGPVVTTNYDRLLEHAFRRRGHAFDGRVVWGAKAELGATALHEGRPFLLKLHGDWEDRGDRVLTRSEYREHYGGDTPETVDWSLALPRLLELLWANRPILFLGCSLTRDRTLTVLRRVAERHPGTAHYAIVEMPSDPEAFRARARHLSEHNVRPIWYPQGRHDLLPDLLAHVAHRHSVTSSLPPLPPAPGHVAMAAVAPPAEPERIKVSLQPGGFRIDLGERRTERLRKNTLLRIVAILLALFMLGVFFEAMTYDAYPNLP